MLNKCSRIWSIAYRFEEPVTSSIVENDARHPNSVFRIRRIDPLYLHERQSANEPHPAQPEQQRDQPSRRRHLILPLSACSSCATGCAAPSSWGPKYDVLIPLKGAVRA